MIKSSVQKFGKFLSGMVMPNIGAFIAWGFITALFINVGWIPNEKLASLVDPMLKYILPILIGITGGKMVAGDRGGVIAAIAVIGVIVGSNVTMFIGAMIMGPLAGLVIKKFDKLVENRIPAGFEMLVNNFSVGILGMILCIIGFYTVGPFISGVTSFLTSGVELIIKNKLLPFVSLFIEPAKVLFLNNAINHGILSPIGAEQALESGKSIMYMLESNPGPGLGVLLSYWMFAKGTIKNSAILSPIGAEQALESGKSIMYMLESNPGPGLGVLLSYWMFAKGTIKNSAPGAAIIHFFGGIHEIYFPYVLMNPLIIIAPIVGSSAAILFYSFFGAGLVGPPSPGSIIAYTALSPRGQILIILAGVLISTLVSFFIAAPIVKRSSLKSKGQDLDFAKEKVKSLKFNDNGEIKKIVFACDAGMGSSAMGATKFRKRVSKLNLDITIINASVDNIPKDADIVVCQVSLIERAKSNSPNSQHITIENFLDDINLDNLYLTLEEKSKSNIETLDNNSDNVEALDDKKFIESIIVKEGIKTGLKSVSKEDAIRHAGELLFNLGYVNKSYIDAMLLREKTVSTYMGLGVAIPHGTSEAKKDVKKTGIVMLGYVNKSYIDAMLLREKTVSTYMGLGVAIPHGTSEAKKDVKKTGIVMLQYPDGVDFGEEKAYLVFGIAGIGDEHLDILEKISSIIEDQEKFEKIKSMSNQDEILSMFN